MNRKGEDTISRRDAIDVLNGLQLKKHMPQETQVTLESAKAIMRLLPSAGPRPKGRWEEMEVTPICDAGIEEVQAMRCSECKRWLTTPYMYYLTKYDFCPNCGADMRQKKEEQDELHRSKGQAD